MSEIYSNTYLSIFLYSSIYNNPTCINLLSYFSRNVSEGTAELGKIGTSMDVTYLVFWRFPSDGVSPDVLKFVFL